jgi:hypothetical protein
MVRCPWSFAAARSDAAIRMPLVVLAIVAWLSSTGYAIDIVAIEEHWELNVGEPDAASSSPQVSMVTSPTGHLYGDYFVFTLNHRSHPHWAAGGLQVQLWDDDEVVDYRSEEIETPLTISDESIAWVQRLRIADGQLVFEVTSGESASWGEFGADDKLRLAVHTPLTTLNNYRPAISLEQSGVSFAGNRVKSLILRKLRWTDSAGQHYELNAPIDVDADLDP